MTRKKDLKALTDLALTGEAKLMGDNGIGFVLRTDEEAAKLVLDSEWLRIKLRDAFDEGASRAGRYGHEDSWDDEFNPHNDNPYRTEDEKEYY